MPDRSRRALFLATRPRPVHAARPAALKGLAA